LKRKAKRARRETDRSAKEVEQKEEQVMCNVRKVFIGGIEEEADVVKKFGKCGKYSFLSFPKDKLTNKGKGIAFITFTTDKGFRNALKLDHTMHKGRTLNVKIAEHNDKGSKGEGKGKGKGKGGKGGKGKGKEQSHDRMGRERKGDKGKGKDKGHRVL